MYIVHGHGPPPIWHLISNAKQQREATLTVFKFNANDIVVIRNVWRVHHNDRHASRPRRHYCWCQIVLTCKIADRSRVQHLDYAATIKSFCSNRKLISFYCFVQKCSAMRKLTTVLEDAVLHSFNI